MPRLEMFGPATLTITQGFSAFLAFLPNFSEIRKSHPETDPDVAADVRMGEIAAVSVTVGMGLICSSLSGSSIPTVTAGLICLILVILYESTLRAHDPGKPKSSYSFVNSDDGYEESNA